MDKPKKRKRGNAKVVNLITKDNRPARGKEKKPTEPLVRRGGVPVRFTVVRHGWEMGMVKEKLSSYTGAEGIKSGRRKGHKFVPFG